MFLKSLIAYLCETVEFTFKIPMWCVLTMVLVVATKLLA